VRCASAGAERREGGFCAGPAGSIFFIAMRFFKTPGKAQRQTGGFWRFFFLMAWGTTEQAGSSESQCCTG
jgi:hypothetical protein